MSCSGGNQQPLTGGRRRRTGRSRRASRASRKGLRGGSFYGVGVDSQLGSAGALYSPVENTGANSATGAIIPNGMEMNATSLRGGRKGRSRKVTRRRKSTRRRRTMRGGASYIGSANVGHGYAGAGVAGLPTHVGYAANVPGPGAGSQVNGVWQTS